MSWLREKTGYDESYWVARVQTLIAQHTSEPKEIPELDNCKHGSTDSLAVIKTLAEEIDRVKPAMGLYDENMWMLAVLGMICSLWYSSLQRAKCFDPNRPAQLRTTAMHRHTDFVTAMASIFVDYSRLSTFFPGQQWDFPFNPNAQNGSFK